MAPLRRQSACFTNVKALVRVFLSRYMDARSHRLQALARFESVAEASGSCSQELWNRDSLHERN